MNCVIPGINLKVISKALQSLAKIGDELYIEAKESQLSLITLNSTKTVCGRFIFFDTFFSTYKVDSNELNEDNQFTLTCKVHLKIFLPLFKGTLEKKLEFFQFEYESESDFIIFKMKYKCDDLLMVHKLRLMEYENLSVGLQPDYGTNRIKATSSFYNQLLGMFNVTDDEITFEITKTKVIARNYCVGSPCRPKMMRTQINLNASEFQRFRIENETTINFSLKPFRTLIQFAENFNLEIEFNFETGGKPLSIILHSPTFDVNFMVATLNPYSDDNSSVSESIFDKKTTPKCDNRNNIINNNCDNGTFSELMRQTRNTPNNSQQNKENEDDVVVVEEEEEVGETPQSKKAKTVFGRCYDQTFHQTMVGGVLLGDSDSE